VHQVGYSLRDSIEMHVEQNTRFGYFIYTRLNIQKWYILPKKFWKIVKFLFVETCTTKPFRFVQVH